MIEGLANLQTYLQLEYISTRNTPIVAASAQTELRLDYGSEAMLSGEESSIQMVLQTPTDISEFLEK